MKLHLFRFDIYLLLIVYFIILCACWYFLDRPHGTAHKIYQHYDCKTVMHVYNYVFVHGTNHASLKFLHSIEPNLRGMMQVRRCRWCGAMTQHVRLSVTLWPCACLSLLCALTLSVAAACPSVWTSICSIRQSILFVFDGWCVILSTRLSDVIQVHCARAECPGVIIRFFFFFNSRLVPFSCHWTPSRLGFFFRECMHKPPPRRMQCERKHRYVLMHIRWRGEKDATL